MALEQIYQGKGFGSEIMNILTIKCHDLKLNAIILSARKTAIGFYENCEFKCVGELYPSCKNGIIHQNMKKVIDV